MEKNIIIGIDIGGTSTKIGFIHNNGEVIYKWEIPTNLQDEGKYIVPEIWESIMSNLERKQINSESIVGIGAGAPGFIDTAKGIVHKAVNIGWVNFKLAELLEQVSNLPVFIGNDANIAALGEHWQGAGKGAYNLIAVTLGTGVGGGIILNGEVVGGANGTAGEIGHMTVDSNGIPCNCGRKGCLETIVSATGIVRQGLDKIKENPNSPLATFYKEENMLTAKDIFTLANEGDSDCEAIVQHTGNLLGFTISNLAIVLNPSKVLIGGGVSKAGDQLLTIIRSSFEAHTLPRTKEICDIEIAQLGNDAGIIGAAYLVKQNTM